MDFCVNLVVSVERIKTVNRRGNCGSVGWILTVLPLENTGKAVIVIKELVLDNLYNPCTCLEATFSYSKTQHFSRPTKCLLIKNPYSLLIFLFTNLALKGLF